jgi:hypothetical protein
MEIVTEAATGEAVGWVSEELALPADMQGRLLRLGELIEQSGLQSLPRGGVKAS